MLAKNEQQCQESSPIAEALGKIKLALSLTSTIGDGGVSPVTSGWAPTPNVEEEPVWIFSRTEGQPG